MCSVSVRSDRAGVRGCAPRRSEPQDPSRRCSLAQVIAMQFEPAFGKGHAARAARVTAPGPSRSCARSVVHPHAARPVRVNSSTTAFDGSGNHPTQPPAPAASRHPVTCVLLLQPRRILRRCIFRVARRRGRDGVCARAQRADQAAPQASSIKSHSLCTCSTHAAVVPCHKDPVAFARPHAAVATRSRHACVMGCAARRASGLEDIRPECEAEFSMAAHARCISASRGDVTSEANARLAPARAARVLLPLEVRE